ncbi:MAG: tetratricopeptide repeat protein, partial [Paludibacteraceae bacterium]|nr:tetratricopeptide repeat protein [Paludibacteraceae bacterium]
VYDKKGKAKVDEKTRKTIATKMFEYYNGNDFIKYGIYLNDQKDYANAYTAFMRHLQIQDLPMMQDPKMQEKMPKDTIYDQYKYYAAIFAIQAEMHDEAIALLEEMKNNEYEAVTVNQFLYQEYVAVKDTAKFVAQLQDAVVRFPKEPWFLQNLINHYIYSGQTEQALQYLSQAIEREPNVAQYRLIKGNIEANEGRYDEAMTEYEDALKVDPTMADAMAGCGRVFYNQAVKMNEDAAYIADAKEYKKALNAMNEMFKKSLPYFEKAHEMDPANRDYMMTLRTLYYRFSMDAEYDKISAELNQ